MQNARRGGRFKVEMHCDPMYMSVVGQAYGCQTNIFSELTSLDLLIRH